MTYYFSIIDNKIISKGQCKLTNAINIEVTKEIFDNSDKYIYQNEQIVLDPDYDAKIIAERQAQFNKDFFNTSLGYIRRKVTMATGETKDFLSDLLPTISMGVQMGQSVTIITYKEPDFTQQEIDWVTLQELKEVTSGFIQECFLQLSNDFKPIA